MRTIPFILSISILIGYKLLQHFLGNSYLPLLIFAPVFILIIINLVLRKKLKHKDWFTKQLNFLNEKVVSKFETDIPPSLIFDKIIEQVTDSNSKLYDMDRSNNQILAGNSIGLRTWGENLYIDIESIDGEKSMITLTSVTVFGLVSWNKNKENIEHFHTSFKESLTI
ncbi:MAG: hypothetical protein MK105_09510 [Crocinitomicaceae bacterium]|nr:hypothetical protein [Crocinitomicaceae bacterium]